MGRLIANFEPAIRTEARPSRGELEQSRIGQPGTARGAGLSMMKLEERAKKVLRMYIARIGPTLTG
jgi:hypothetical protein